MIIDLHCDTIMTLLYSKHRGVERRLRENDGQLDLLKMKKGDYMAQTFAMFVPYRIKGNEEHSPKAMCDEMIDIYYSELESNSDIIKPAYNYQDIIDNHNNGLMSGILSIEEGGVLEGDIDNLRHFYDRGVRMICLNWNFENGVGHPNYSVYDEEGKPNYFIPNTKDGLTDFGFEMIKNMEELGIIIDLSHMSDKGFYDVYNNTKGPFICSHSNARAICPHVRNLTDDMIIKLNERGGIMGMNYCADFVDSNSDYSYVSKLVEHIKYIKKLVGVDVIALGSDFDGIDRNVELEDASKMGLLKDALIKEGFSLEEIDKIFYKNALRVFKAILK